MLSNLDQQSLASSLWHEWKIAGSNESRNRLFEHYFPWCRKIASSLFSRYHSRKMEWQDYVSIASLATLLCIDQFDASKNSSFEAFCYPYIKGKILNEINKQSLESKRIGTHDFTILENYEKSETFDFFIDATIEMTFGLLIEHSALQDFTHDQPVNIYEKEQISRMIRKCIFSLEDDTERLVVQAYYMQHLTITQISETLELSKSRVSQIHRKALKNIREIYESLT